MMRKIKCVTDPGNAKVGVCTKARREEKEVGEPIVSVTRYNGVKIV